ncbi:MAG: type II secretion system major pseudopilin GspG [Deltaproteobacteria bacterium]|nr:type II secretion system major pseudopilin GspG [Deltaproteobacteria bacterium]
MRARGEAGFTLIEIMVVVFILALLVALVAPNLMGNLPKAEVAAAKTQIKSLSAAVHTFRLDNGRYPTTAEGLRALIPPPPANLPRYDPDGYIEDVEAVPEDPWHNPYAYVSDGRRFEIISYGRDGQPGGDGEDADLSSRRS